MTSREKDIVNTHKELLLLTYSNMGL